MRGIRLAGPLSGSPRSRSSQAPFWRITTPTCRTSGICPSSRSGRMTLHQTSLWAERPASPSASPDSERDWMTRVATSCSPSVQLLAAIGPSGWFGRTSPASCHLTEGGILEPSSGCWQNSGMGSPTGFLTLNTSEWPSDAAVCSLSDTLETGDVPLRYFLSETACRGILRRAAKRGKRLPRMLHLALEAVASCLPSTPVSGDSRDAPGKT